MEHIKINYTIEKNTISKLKSYDIDNFRSKNLHLWIGVDAIQGNLIIELNDKYLFEIPKDALKILQEDNFIIDSISDPYNRFGLNGVCLVDWFHNLVESTIALILGKNKISIEIIEHSIDISIFREEERLFISFNKSKNGNPIHWLSPYLTYDIKDEPIPINTFVSEVIRSTNSFINELLEINPEIKEEEVFNNLHIDFNKLNEIIKKVKMS
jgi:hypothetical protein